MLPCLCPSDFSLRRKGVNIVVRWPFLLPFPQHLVCLQIFIICGDVF